MDTLVFVIFNSTFFKLLFNILNLINCKFIKYIIKIYYTFYVILNIMCNIKYNIM